MSENNLSNDLPKVPWSAEEDVTHNFFPVVYKFPTAESPQSGDVFTVIFWGPGQDTTYKQAYVEPPPEKFENLQLLEIPLVIRTFHGHNEAYSPPPPPPPPDPGGGTCTLGNGAYILLGYQHGQEGRLLTARMSDYGVQIPPLFAPPNAPGYPCSGATFRYKFYKDLVVLNEISDNYGTTITTSELVDTIHVSRSHNKSEFQNIVSTSVSRYTLSPVEQIVNISGVPTATGCFVHGPTNPPGGRDLPLPNTPSDIDGNFPDISNGQEQYQYLIDGVFGLVPPYRSKFTIFFWISCKYLAGFPETVGHTVVPGEWTTDLPPDLFSLIEVP